jgi:hypothetical protein
MKMKRLCAKAHHQSQRKGVKCQREHYAFNLRNLSQMPDQMPAQIHRRTPFGQPLRRMGANGKRTLSRHCHQAIDGKSARRRMRRVL